MYLGKRNRKKLASDKMNNRFLFVQDTGDYLVLYLNPNTYQTLFRISYDKGHLDSAAYRDHIFLIRDMLPTLYAIFHLYLEKCD